MNLVELVAKIGLDSSEYESGLSKLASGVGSVAKAGLAAAGAATAAVTAFAASSVSAGMDFDSSMSQVAATMGLTNEELQNNIVTVGDFTGNLRDFAQMMGSTTAFSATQAADALNYMALAGYDAETSVSMLPTVLNLAAAGGIELASASDMVTDAQTALGLTLEETTVMVDQMAQTSSKSNTSVEQLGEAFLTIGGNAKDLSGGTAELSQALGLLADNGIKGSEAGTHLRNIMLSLNPTTDDAVAAWDSLGVSAYDAEGNLRPLEDTFLDLQGAMDGMSSQERTEMLSQMFNKTDLASVNALLATNGERWDELAGYIDNASGAAEQMAATQLDNLEGDITLFQSALEGAQIAISDGLTPSLREFVQFGSDGLSQMTTAFKEDGLSGAMSEFGTILSEGLNMVIEMLPSLVDAGMQLLQALIDGVIQNLPTLIDASIQILGTIAQGIIENLPTLLEAAIQIIVQLALGLAEALPDLVPTIVDVILTIVDTLINNIDLLVDASIAIMVGLTEGIINALPTLIERVPEIIAKLVEAFANNAPKLVVASLKMMSTLAAALVTYLPILQGKVPQLMTSLKNSFITYVSGFKDVGKNIIEGIRNGIDAGWDALKEYVAELAKKLLQAAKDALGIHSPSKEFKWIAEMCVAGFDEGMKDFMDADKLGSSITKSVNIIKDNIDDPAGSSMTSAFSQTVNIYNPAQSPDELARQIRLESRYGLMRGVTVG